MAGIAVDDRRSLVHGMWAAVAPRWADHADDVDARGAEMTQRLLALADVRPGHRVLELASGPGGAGLAAATMTGATGRVVISDVAPEMVAIAAARVRDRGLRNVVTAVLDLEALDQPAATFDSVVCREGLMFAVEPAQAVAEISRVLRPGGRLAVSVWGPRQLNPWLGVVLDAVATVTGMQVPPAGMPGPFALSDRGGLLRLLEDAGFDEITVEELPVPLRSPSFERWWARTADIAGPVAGIIGGLDAARRASLEQHLRTATAPYTTANGLELPGLALNASGQRQ